MFPNYDNSLSIITLTNNNQTKQIIIYSEHRVQKAEQNVKNTLKFQHLTTVYYSLVQQTKLFVANKSKRDKKRKKIYIYKKQEEENFKKKIINKQKNISAYSIVNKMQVAPLNLQLGKFIVSPQTTRKKNSWVEREGGGATKGEERSPRATGVETGEVQRGEKAAETRDEEERKGENCG